MNFTSIETLSKSKNALGEILSEIQLEDRELSSGSGDGDNFDGDGDDGDDEWGDGGDDSEDDKFYLEDKLNVARDGASILSEARVIFQKDKNTGKTILICLLDELEPPEEYLNRKTMFISDIILRPFQGYTNPKKVIDKVKSSIFKKRNWKEEL